MLLLYSDLATLQSTESTFGSVNFQGVGGLAGVKEEPAAAGRGARRRGTPLSILGFRMGAMVAAVAGRWRGGGVGMTIVHLGQMTRHVIRLQRIYNFLLFPAVILFFLDVLYAFICYFIIFLGLTY